ncbi:hypothetical protein D3C71_2131620 [compost metagenome]
MYIKYFLCILIRYTRCEYNIFMGALRCEPMGEMHKPADAGAVRFTSKRINKEHTLGGSYV